MAYKITNLDSNRFFHLNSGQSAYVGYLPKNYVDTKSLPLFVWSHGCGGNAEGDLWTIKSENYIAISIGGRDGACWQPGTDNQKVLSAISDVSTYYNIDKNKIFLGGYSSGGDLTYRVGFENAGLFAGLLVENSDPFRDTGSNSANLIKAASWKINIAHLAHLSDATYPITTVRNSINTLKVNGFPATLIEKAGTHWDDDKGTTGTNYDLVNFLLPYIINANWSLNNTGTTTTPTTPTVLSDKNIVATTATDKAPGDQGFTSTKKIPDGYNVPAGDYSLTVATRTTYSDNSTVVVDLIMYSNQSKYDLSWDSMTIDLRGAMLGSFWDCSIVGTTGIITITPTSNTKKILANNKNGFGFTFTRSSDKSISYYQPLVKKINW